MLAASAAVSLLLVSSPGPAPDPRAYAGAEAVPNDRPATAPEGPAEVTLLHTRVAAESSEPSAMPRYFQAPLTEMQWKQLEGRAALLIFGTSGRECVTVTRADKAAVFYTHRKFGPQQAPLGTVTSVHENSWECAEDRDETPAEWARVGAAVGVSVSAVGMLMGILYDVGRAGKTDPGDYNLKHFMYAPVGVTTTLLGTPIVAIGGASTSRDLRVRGKIWARGLGYALYAGAVVTSALWLIGQYADKERLTFVGVTSLSGALGLAGSSFMAIDALASRAELKELHRQDTGQARISRLRVGAGPFAQGFMVGLGGRF